MIKKFLIIFFALITSMSCFANKVVNIYAWSGEIPKKLIQQFEKETGIRVHFSTYDSNETLYAKLKSSKSSIYDVILPSGYYVERMRKQNMLTKLNLKQLSNIHNLDPFFTRNIYDIGNQYSIPLVWGTTGLFYNSKLAPKQPKRWDDLWQAQWKKQLLLLDDPREIFSVALMSLGFDANDTNPTHIQLAYEKLLQLVPNIKLFASDGVQAIMIDEDAPAGIMWNSDAYKAHKENPAIEFVYPKEGFVIWIDCLAIPKNPPHPKEAHAFINFMLKASSAAMIANDQGLAITNLAGKKLLSLPMQNNRMIYPLANTLKHGFVQQDVGEDVILLYNHYWQNLKLAF